MCDQHVKTSKYENKIYEKNVYFVLSDIKKFAVVICDMSLCLIKF